jgi:hypothetical protein
MQTLAAFWTRTNPLSRNLFLFALVSFFWFNLGLTWFSGVPLRDSALADTNRFVRFKDSAGDSWKPMVQALRYLQSPHDQPLYTHVFFEQQTKFQYPPTSLLLMLPAVFPPTAEALTRLGLSWVWLLDRVSAVLIWIMAFFLIRIFHTRRNDGPLSLPDRCLSLLTWLMLTFTFYPLVKGYSLGQVQVWINALFAVLFWSWLTGRKGLAGFLAGVVCLIKPQYGLLLVWGVLRRQRRFVTVGVVTSLVGLTLSISLFGVANHLDYLRVLSYLSRHGESYYPNQSMNGLLHRLLFNGNNLDWNEHAFPPYNGWVHAGTLLTSVVLLALALWAQRRDGSARDFAIMALTTTIASPVAWEHHYGILLPLYAFLVPTLYERRSRWGLVVIGVSYVLCANFFPVLNYLAPTGWNVLQSYLLAGGLLALACLYRISCLPAAVEKDQPLPQAA